MIRPQRNLAALQSTDFDVVVIGGGICGAAAAWDAAQRGLTVALLERGDFGGATSANSLKIVHGGIRYLQHLDVRRVRESSRERSALLRIAPHLVRPLPVLVPAFGHGRQGPAPLGAAFLLLNALTWDRNRRLDPSSSSIPAARLVSRSQVLQQYPQLERRRLTGGGVFWDAQLLNPPRLVWEFVRTAAREGAVVANYCEVGDLICEGNRVVGVAATDRLADRRIEVRARIVINAAGPYAEQLHVKAGLQQGRKIPLSRDLALVLARRCPGSSAIALPTAHRDPDALLSRGPRHIFLVPWRDVTLVGVQSTIFRGDPDLLSVSEEEVSLFLREVNMAASWLDVGRSEVAMVYAGLLPAGAGEMVGADLSFGKRSHIVDHGRTRGLEGLITAMPNRFTTARGVAERAVNLAGQKLGRRLPPCRTAVTPLLGAPRQSLSQLQREVTQQADTGLDGPGAERLVQNHGSAWSNLLPIIQEAPGLARPVGGTQTMGAEVVHAARNEMAHRLADCVFRRTEIGSFGHPGEATLRISADLMTGELGWTPQRREAELEDVRSRFLLGSQRFEIEERKA